MDKTYTLRRREMIRLSGIALATTLVGCTSGSVPSEVTVKMTSDLRFDPKSTRVKKGGTVRWINESNVPHTVTAYADKMPENADYFASGGFNTEKEARQNMKKGFIEPNQSYQHTFGVSGIYEYFCIPHEGSGMVGKIEVVD
ncbi:MAG: plastocyanin/azurin family copper-binding protein [Halobacteria archaeon]|nr:plastocyanin/azurin family copper-binding protein [Halobacteria archaeon]